MTYRAAVLGLSGLAPILASCSSPAPPPSQPAENATVQPRPEWRRPTIATAVLRRDYLAAPTGIFEAVGGCLSFAVGEVSYTPVFSRTAPPRPDPAGFSWGGRQIRYGEKVRMNGGQARPDLEIDAEARRKCPGPFIVISGFPPRNPGELKALQERREAGTTGGRRDK